MNQDLSEIKPVPLMTQQQMIEAITRIDQQVTEFITSYNSKFYGNKSYVDGKVIMSKGRQEVGSGNNILILDGQNTLYRMWAGASSPGTTTPAPLRITKEGLLQINGATVGGRFSGAVISAALESGWNTSGWSVTNPSTGTYTVTHNLGHTNYSVLLTVFASNAKIAVITTRSVNSFTVVVTNNVGSLENNNFFFELVLKA